jgi:hypothetical protein
MHTPTPAASRPDPPARLSPEVDAHGVGVAGDRAAAGAPAEAAGAPRWDGFRATIVGTDGSDTIRGTLVGIRRLHVQATAPLG